MRPNEVTNIYTEQAVEDAEFLWFASCEENIFCRLSKRTGVVSKVCDLPIENALTKRAYRAICRNGKYFVIAPWMGKSIVAIYDYNTGDMISIPLKNLCSAEQQACTMLKFSKCIVYKNFVYLTGLMYPAIVKIDLENFSIEYIEKWIKELDGIKQIPKGYYLAEGDVIRNMAYLPIACTNAILKLNLDTGYTQIIGLNTTLENLNGLAAYENKLWINGRYQGKVISVDLETEQINEICMAEDATTKNAALFTKPIFAEGRMLLLPVVAQHAYWIDPENETVELCKELEPYIQRNKKKCGKKSHCLFIVAYDSDKLYFSLLGDQNQYQYIFALNKVNQISTICDYKLASQIMLRRCNGFVSEKEQFNGTDFISALIHTAQISNTSCGKKESDVGARIYKTILRKGE